MEILLLYNNDDDLLSVLTLNEDEVESAKEQILSLNPEIRIESFMPISLEETLEYMRDFNDDA